MKCVNLFAKICYCRQRREQLKEYRKKKTQKKLQKQQVLVIDWSHVFVAIIIILQEVEELREKEKDRWKNFTQKV